MIQFTNTSDRSATTPMTVWELVVANLDATNHIVAAKMILNLRQIISCSRSWFKNARALTAVVTRVMTLHTTASIIIRAWEGLGLVPARRPGPKIWANTLKRPLNLVKTLIAIKGFDESILIISLKIKASGLCKKITAQLLLVLAPAVIALQRYWNI